MHIPQPIHAEVPKEHTYEHRPLRKKENALISGEKTHKELQYEYCRILPGSSEC
jgi:hypothetical protein